jgi:hypothetical protein
MDAVAPGQKSPAVYGRGGGPSRRTEPSGGAASGSRPKDRRNAFARLAIRAGRIAAAVGFVLVTLRLAGCMERLFYLPTAGPTPPPPAFPRAEVVRFAAADGTPLVGWFIPAEGHASGAGGGAAALAPTILHVHGNAGNVESHLWFSEFLPRAGFNLFLFDYRGYGESGGHPRRRDDLIADTSAALDAVLARRDVDPTRVGVFGQSLGGAVALNVMKARKEIRCAVIVSAFASWRSIAADALSPRAEPGPVARGLAALCIGDHCAPVNAIARIDRPILLVHGVADEIIPVHHSRRLAAAARSARLVELAGGGHNDIRDTNPEFDAIVVRFLVKGLVVERAEEPVEELPEEEPR